MSTSYYASTLPDDEYIVLDCLCCAHHEGETPIALWEFQQTYELLSEVASDVEKLAQVLAKLNEKKLAGQDFQGCWLPTKYGQDVMEWKESTRT